MSRKRRPAIVDVAAGDAVDLAIAHLERVIGNLENEIRIRRAAVDAIKTARRDTMPKGKTDESK